MGLVTRDPLLYGELALYFRERHIPTLSFLPGDRLPERVAVVVTSPAELPEIDFPHTVVAEPGDLTTVGVAVREALRGRPRIRTLVLGVDPGPRPGFALLDDRRACLTQGTAEDPENVARLARKLREDFPAAPLTIRVGDGDPPSQARILRALAPLDCPVELVDEVRTTLPGRRQNDPLAAKAIAATSGRPVAGPTAWRITRGAVANLQRISREASGGRLTISRSLAASVLRGHLPLGEAIRLTDRGHPASSRPAGGTPGILAAAGDNL